MALHIEVTKIHTANRDGLNRVATMATFRATLVDEKDETNSVHEDLSINLGAPDPNDFTPAKDITTDVAEPWVRSRLGTNGIDSEAAIEKRLRKRLEEQASAEVSEVIDLQRIADDEE